MATSWLWPSGMTLHCEFLPLPGLVAGVPTGSRGPQEHVPRIQCGSPGGGRGAGAGVSADGVWLGALGRPPYRRLPEEFVWGRGPFAALVGPGGSARPGGWRRRGLGERSSAELVSPAPSQGFARLVTASGARGLPRPVPWGKLVPDLQPAFLP